jgi:hypothetical protein
MSGAGNYADLAAVTIFVGLLGHVRIPPRTKLRQGLLGNLAERLRRVLQ